MGPLSLAEARSRGYGLLGRLLLRGLDEETLPLLKQTPLGAQLPDALDLDEVAAAHHRLLSREVHPYASLFLTPDPAGRVDAIQDACQSAGFHVDTASARPDHFGIGLMMMSFLCGATADAMSDGLDAIAAQTEALAQSFLSAHLAPYVAPLRAAVVANDAGLWAAVVVTAADMLTDHLTEPGPLVLPDVPDLLRDERTDLKRIAAFLLTPCHSGVFLSRSDISVLARGVRVPRGFGSRQQELVNLLRSAAEYDQVRALLAGIDGVLAARAATTAGPHEAVWRARITATRQTVTALGQMV